MNEISVLYNQYIVIINHDRDNSYNDGFVINITKVIIANSSNSSTINIKSIILATIATIY